MNITAMLWVALGLVEISIIVIVLKGCSLLAGVPTPELTGY